MLKQDIENLKTKAVKFLQEMDKKAQRLGITIVSLQEGKMVFLDNESGVQVSADLVHETPADSVPATSNVGTPSIKLN